MFLDEKLFQICSDTEINTADDVNNLNAILCGECENYYKSRNIKNDKQLKIILDKTFNLWNSFVNLLAKSDDQKLLILSTMFKKYTFKRQFLNSDEMKEIYESLK